MNRHREKRSPSLIFLCFTYILFFTNPFVLVAKSLTQAQQLKIGDVLISDSETFGLEFLNIAGDNNWYLGISYRFERGGQPVWVANRNKPIPNDSAILTIDDKGSLIIKYGDEESLPLYSVKNATNTIATLEKNGNFVLRDSATRRVLWQSFDDPTDTLLPEMKLGFNKRTGQNWTLTSWKTGSSPSSGFYTFGIDPNHPTELTIWRREYIYWRSTGAWLKEHNTLSQTSFTSNPADTENYTVPYYNFVYSSNEDEVNFTYSVHKNASAEIQNRERPKLFISDMGILTYEYYQTLVMCSASTSKLQWSLGCDKNNTPSCGGNRYETGTNYPVNGFMSSKGFKIKEAGEDISLQECEAICRSSCSCSAFSSDRGCELWSPGTLFTNSDGADPQAQNIIFVDRVNETGSLSQGHDLNNGHQLLSNSRNFTLRFFKTGNSTGWYLGIWHTSDDINPVWVANRNVPIFSDFVLLTVDDKGSLVIKYGGGKVLSLHSVINETSTYATLEDNGNFVLRNNYDNGMLWQSFDHPTDTLLPQMKLGFNRATGQNWSLTSWRTDYLPANGSFTFGVDPNHPDVLTIWWRGRTYWRSGTWQQGQGTFNHTSVTSTFFNDYKISYSTSEEEVYFNFSLADNGATRKLHRLTITPLGELYFGQRQIRLSCSITNSAKELDSGCEKQPECRSQHKNGEFPVAGFGFMSTNGLKIKESEDMTSYDCEALCWNNCSCMAYSNTSGCEIWIKGTKFTRAENDPRAQNIILVGKFDREENMTWMISLIAIGVLLGLLIFCYGFYVILNKIKIEVERIIKRIMLIREIGGRTVVSTLYEMAIGQTQEHNLYNEIQIFSFRSIVIATKNFSAANKLGQGGFGSVYKGKLPNGKEMAIKRLSERSRQGLVEFKNEAILMARLQHTSLVRVLGYCIERDERILVYEYMPNKSLDCYIFDSERNKMLNWHRRFNIIEEIAQGLVYLHMYYRLTVIHRDLKASNILLDSDMNPKISDFGMARIFQQRGVEETTNRIVGTHGYMSPEYALNGIVSMKTDVFSFGVLILEIMSGKKNYSRYHSDYPFNLIGLAWELWNKDKVMELIDRSLLHCCPTHEALRCVQLGLLCVQDRAADRPNMLEVVSMLTNESAILPAPRKPTSYVDVEVEKSSGSEENQKAFSINEVTITKMDAR